MSENSIDNAQLRFEKTYITSSEIMSELGLSRANLLYARKNGKLPEAIDVNNGQIFIWERDVVRPYIDAWKLLKNISNSGK